MANPIKSAVTVADLINLSQPQVMGILNITPDSYYERSCYLDPQQACVYAQKMVADGASMIDIGAEATNPQLNPCMSAQEELDRLLPVLECLVDAINVPISVDTSKPEIMCESIKLGAQMINDVRALTEPGAVAVVAELGVPVVLMHMCYPHGKTSMNATQQSLPTHPIMAIKTFLQARITACITAGISEKAIIIDPGIGHGNFGKDLQQNLQILQQLSEFKALKLPILVGVSRKTFIGELLDLEVSDRLYPSIAAATLAVNNGATIIRAHDVKATYQAIQLAAAVIEAAS